ncbi:RimJ/RimL family protein N-acetyltransferase [Hydrogenispora ethanolica]|uniref:RimJ/RimL family protein N-acetyltransferase n=1 Tax=Hydrogenispora ethanolica TaxID=1082276 RepID=A0A4R1S055_HYDET|nr:GNAT family protein [Hydrogenispora ethanolica]TCL72446.1 RimJ/RimL family protein N-acetyltransferase [Hydrogenispora ethanolica]
MLIGEQVTIRPLQKDDLELLYQWRSDQESMGGFMDTILVNEEKFLEGMEAVLGDKGRLDALIEDLEGNPIGILSYHEVAGSNVALEIGILIAEPSARGKGIGRECLELFVDHLFGTKPLMRVQFLTRVDNHGMRRSGEKAGFSLEGVLRKFALVQGEYRDFCMMAITRDDWKAMRSPEKSR